MRELGLWEAERGVARAFRDIEELAEGVASAGRLDSLRRLRRELAAQELRADERARRASGRRGSRALREALRAKPGRR
jgi:hypothetical protein